MPARAPLDGAPREPAILAHFRPCRFGRAAASATRLDAKRAGRGDGVAARRVGVRRPEISIWIQAVRLCQRNAPKGGAARQIALGTYDNFNMVVDGVKGALAVGIDLNYDTLLVAALDEVSSGYGLLAEAVSYPDDFSSARSSCGPKRNGMTAPRSRPRT